MACKVTFYFNVRGKVGFSETWINNAVDDPDALPTATLRSVSNGGMSCRGDETALDGIRVSSVATPRLTRLRLPDELTQDGFDMRGTFNTVAPTPGGYPSDFGDTALQVLCASVNLPTLFRRFFLRGQPDRMVNFGGQYVPFAGYNATIVTYLARLTANGFGWYSRRTNQAGFPALITGATQNAADGTIAFTLAGTPFLVGQIGKRLNATIAGQVVPPTLNGGLTIQVDSTNTCHSIRFLPLGPFSPNSGRMNIKAAPTFQPLLNGRVQKVVERKGGRPFDLARGRSRPRRTV